MSGRGPLGLRLSDAWRSRGGPYPARGSPLRALPGVFGPYEILETATGDVVGGIGFHRPPAPDGSVEIGYSVAVTRQNRGYATAALALIIEIALGNGVQRLEARRAHKRRKPACT